MDAKSAMKNITARARKAARELSVAPTKRKDRALELMADALHSSGADIKKANEADIAAAREGGKNAAFLDRLRIDDKRLGDMCAMMRDVAALRDPVGAVMERVKRPNGLVIEKVRVPIGVIGVVYESRPNVTADCVALCLKSGNSVILRGGSDAIRSNRAIYEAMRKAAAAAGIPDGAFILVEDTSREMVDAMLEAAGDIDLIMPRGGESLIREVAAKSRIPVIKHYKGICHIYVDSDADLAMAEKVCLNAKVQRPGVCNAMETMLVHEAVAEKFLKAVGAKLRQAGVKLKGCAVTRRILGDDVALASDDDYATEWLDLVLSIKVVNSADEAIEHIAKFGSDHSDAIITRNKKRGLEFIRRVDSAAVYLNASTRFTDGGEFGKGAEIGISTDKLHARGPMGLEELTSYKYVVYGTGQIRT